MTNVGAHIDATDVYNTNPNLLDNPFWTVNQRSAVSITGSSSGTPSVDRWLLFGSGTTTDLTVTANGVSVHSATNGFAQRMPSDLGDFLDGKTVTLSVMDTSGEVASGSLVYDKTTLKNTGSLTIGSYTCTIYAGKSGNFQLVSITTGANTIPLRAVKLELGSVSTLANDTPPNYADELSKCQYYFERISAGTANLTIGTGIGTGTYFYTPIKLHPKRTAPTVTYSGSVGIGRSAYETDITAIYTNGSSSDPNTGNYTLAVTVTNTTQTAYRLIIKTGGYIDFSADL